MKKKLLNTLIACGIAVIGIGASMSGALALYVTNAEDKDINISLSTVSYDAELGISDITAADITKKLNPTQRSVDYKYKLSATVGAESTFKQDVLVGKLDITFKTKNLNLFKSVTVTNIIDYKNYSSNPSGTDTYFSTTADLNTVVLSGTEVLQGEYYVMTGSISAPISILYGNDVNLSVALKDTIVDSNFIDVAAAEYSIDVALTKNVDYQYAHVMGLKPVGATEADWTASDHNQMCPNIYATEGFEWMWRASVAYPGSTIKCVSGEIWSAGNNQEVDVAVGDSVYWDGTALSPLNFYHPTTA